MTGASWPLVLFVAVLCLWPLILVGLFALLRRHPGGVPARHRWKLLAVWAVVPAALAIDAFLGGDGWRAAVSALQAVFFAWFAADQRRRAMLGAAQVS